MTKKNVMLAASFALGALGNCMAQADEPDAVERSTLMQLEGKIPLGDVKGRIDHLAMTCLGDASSWPSSATIPSQWSI
jgi:hypothetical protein